MQTTNNATLAQQVLATKFYKLLFTNSANEVEDYGTHATETGAHNKIARMQAEYGADAFANEFWTIEVVTLAQLQFEEEQQQFVF